MWEFPTLDKNSAGIKTIEMENPRICMFMEALTKLDFICRNNIVGLVLNLNW